ncbi:MAG: ATPase [Actinomycetota bacterium]|nr:ATPase [Actinomycetota bacterium]
MELYPLIDKLDDVVANARKVRLSGDVRVNRQEARAIVAQMRGAMPEELQQAHWIAENRDEMITEAKRESARILEEAREERARLLGREEIATRAEQRAQRLLDGARARERDIRLGGEDFAGDMLARLETYLANLSGAVGRGRGRLGERDQAPERGGDRVVEREAALVA